MRRRVTQIWQTRTSYPWAGVDPRLVETSTTLVDSNQVSKQTFGYDDSVPFNNQNNVKEYTFGAGAAGNLIRETRTTYLTGSNYTGTSVHIRNLPLQVSVYDSGGIERARSTFEYDNYTLDGLDCEHSFHCLLLVRSNISGLDAAFTSGYTTRGNATASTRYLLVNGSVTGSTSTYSFYDVAGNVVKAIDPRSTLANIIATTFEYDDRFGTPDTEARSNTAPALLGGQISYAFPTKVINALGHTAYTQFDYNLGQPVNGEDANGIVSSGHFVDPLDRPTQVRRAVATGVENQTTFAYDDANRIITTSSDLHVNNDNVLVSKVVYDQLGRTTETRQYEGGSNYIVTKAEYDALGRPFKTSNPYRPWQSESAVWTTTAFDALGRVTSVTTPDNAVMSTSYSGNTVTVTDQAGKKRKSVTDALGRLAEVYEDPEVPGGPTELNYQTAYVYDALDNLVKVTQGSQQRFFMYDSLKRLIRARNPEQGTHLSLNLSDAITGNSDWSIRYDYDSSSNLTLKKDAREVESSYAYDVLNRNTTINYSDTTTINPDVKRFYDGATNGKGRFWYFYTGGDYSTGSNVEHTAIDSYDALGRPLVQRQLFKLNGAWSPTYQTSRMYNAAGGVKSQTYPSLRSVTYNYDSAGRLADKDASSLAFRGNLGDGVLRTYARGNTYSPWGSLSREQYGTDITLHHKLFYNIRGQLFDIRLSSVNDAWDWNRGRLILYYSSNHLWGQSGTDNNGNVRFAETWIPPDGAALDQAKSVNEQTYSYDALNRLSSVTEARMDAVGGWVWQQQFRQTYIYDRYGNRTIDGPQTWGVGINNKQFDVETTTNRLKVPSGQSGVLTYDFAGNLITDTYTGAGAREYDAENRMTRAWGGINQWQYYTYNADGHRTRRKIDTQETWQIYGMDGELLAEYPANGAASSPQKEYGYRNGQLLITASSSQRQWLIADHLGTPRMIIDQMGSLVNMKRHDYLPFGEELGAGVAGRSAGDGYTCGDGVRQQFTSKERDIETGLDYFGARYFASTQGRFTSSDPLLASGRTNVPQSWNRYSYVLNNPLRLVDPDGMADLDPQKVVEIGKDKAINKKLEEIRSQAKPLEAGVTPVPTQAVIIPGEQTKLDNATIVGPDGEPGPSGITGYMRPIALVVLDQGGNIMKAPDDLFVVENAQPVNGDAKQIVASGGQITTNQQERGQANNGAFYDLQLRVHGSQTRDALTTQDVTVRQYFGPKSTDYKEIFQVSGNKIRFDDRKRSVRFTPGTVKKL